MVSPGAGEDGVPAGAGLWPHPERAEEKGRHAADPGEASVKQSPAGYRYARCGDRCRAGEKIQDVVRGQNPRPGRRCSSTTPA